MDTKQATATLSTAIRARTPVIAIASSEETRVIDAIMNLASQPTVNMAGAILVQSRMVFQWTITNGIIPLSATPDNLEFGAPAFEPNADPGLSLLQYCEWAAARDVQAATEGTDDLGATGRAIDERASILVLCDVHRFINTSDGGDKVTLRALRDAFAMLRRSKSVAILLAPVFVNLGDAGHDILKINWPLPSVSELTDMIREAAAKLGDRIPVNLNGDTEVLARALGGMTWNEAMRTLSMAMVEAGALSVEACAERILAIKASILKNQRGLEMITATGDLNDVGGLDLLKAEMAALPASLTLAAKNRHVKPPRGILLAGPPGTGKTLTAKVAGAAANMPVLIWSVGETHSKWLGESAQYTREVLSAVDAIDNCILVVDEADTQLAEGGEGDSAAHQEQMGMVLTWMQEKTSNVVVMFTSNHPERMRDALLERCNQRWFVDYPDQDACEQIIAIHLRKRDMALTRGEIASLAALASSKSLAGRNIEDAIDRANSLAFMAGRAMTADDLSAALNRAKGLMQNRADQAKSIRQWCMDHCEPASTPKSALVPGARHTPAGVVDVEL